MAVLPRPATGDVWRVDGAIARRCGGPAAGQAEKGDAKVPRRIVCAAHHAGNRVPFGNECPACLGGETVRYIGDADRARVCSDSQSGADRAAYYGVRVGSRHWLGFLSSSS